jgi:hypothetical protein
VSVGRAARSPSRPWHSAGSSRGSPKPRGGDWAPATVCVRLTVADRAGNKTTVDRRHVVSDVG